MAQKQSSSASLHAMCHAEALTVAVLCCAVLCCLSSACRGRTMCCAALRVCPQAVDAMARFVRKEVGRVVAVVSQRPRL